MQVSAHDRAFEPMARFTLSTVPPPGTAAPSEDDLDLQARGLHPTLPNATCSLDSIPLSRMSQTSA